MRLNLRARGVLLGAAVLAAAVPLSACNPPPRTVTYRFAFEVNVHDETSLGYSHLFDTVGITVDPTGYVTNMTSSLSSDGYGVESATTSVNGEGEGTTQVGPSVNIKGWTTYHHTDASWAIHVNYGINHFTLGHCYTHFNYSVESGGGTVESNVYPLATWSGSCTNNQYLSTKT